MRCLKHKDPEIEERRRGRPVGRNRAPFSLEERRRRNAQYERERRVEQAQAYGELSEALGSKNQMSNCDLLAAAVSYISGAEDLEAARKLNEDMKRQIADLEQRLAPPKVEPISVPQSSISSEGVSRTRPFLGNRNKNRCIEQSVNNGTGILTPPPTGSEDSSSAEESAMSPRNQIKDLFLESELKFSIVQEFIKYMEED